MLGVTALIFVMTQVIPADPARVAAGPGAGEAQVEALRQAMGLDRPVPEQFLRYLSGLTRLDLGRSIRTQQPVLNDIIQFLPASLELILFSFTIYGVLGISLGVLAAVNHHSTVDIIIRIGSIAAFAVPIYVLGLWLQYLLYFQLDWFPGGGRLDILTSPPPRVTGFYLIDSLWAGNLPLFFEALHHMALPAITLVLGLIAVATRLTRAGMLTQLRSKYVQVARLKGLPERTVIIKHALRNSLIPVVTLMGLQFGYLIGGAVIVEQVFQMPGLGQLAVGATTQGDIPIVMGLVVATALIVILVNLIIDIAQGLLNPKVRLA